MKVIIQEIITNVDVSYIKEHEIEIADFVVQTDVIKKSLLDAKGDMIAASADDTAARVPAGSDGQMVVADSAQAAGVKFANHDKAVHDAMSINADTVDSIHASASAEANKLLALDGTSKLPASITGDADTVDGFHGHDGTKAVHDALNINADTLDTKHAADLVAVADHTKAAHDALNIDADTLDSHDTSYFATSGHVHALGDLSNVTATGEGSGGGFDADTVDGKHWSSMKYAGCTGIVGNKDVVLTGSEQVEIYVPFACNIKEIHMREVFENSGTATITLYRYDSDDDTTETSIQTISFSSQWYKTITGLTLALDAGDWLEIKVSGTPSGCKMIAVGIRVERT